MVDDLGRGGQGSDHAKARRPQLDFRLLPEVQWEALKRVGSRDDTIPFLSAKVHSPFRVENRK